MEWLDVLKDLNAGTVGGVAGIAAGHPLDTVKVRLQTLDASKPTAGVVSTLRQIVAAEGPLGLYKGLLSPILSNAPINAVVFGVQGVVSRGIKEATDQEMLTPSQQFLSGAAAGVAQVVFAAPSEHVKIQMQVNSARQHESSIECGKNLYRRHGLRGLFRGWQMCMARDVPAFGVYFFTYEVTKRWMTDGNPENESDMRLLLSGGIAGSISWLVSHPIDVVKSCVQSQGFRNQRTAWQLTQDHFAAEGPQYFLKGFGATMLRAFPVSAVTFLVYEKTMQFMS